ncbi:MAG: lipoyl(octanoyl) transferase LipB [Bacteroidales bacterium]|nr:lipoyl(octanoyl) transferase LipB [Bacteroidales bacterium]
MKYKILFKDLGQIGFQEAWDYQKNLFHQIMEIKSNNRDLPICEQTENYNFFLLCEHPHVYTLGKSGSEANLLINQELLASKGAEFYKIDRGGDITYHGPGQIVGYPILDLENVEMGVKQYIYTLEEVIINTLDEFHIKASRLENATGVWIDPEDPLKARKICAIGVKVSRYVTMHGFAFNVNTDLHYYDYINPCGFTDKGVTSMEKELGKKQDMEKVKIVLLQNFNDLFGFSLRD